MEGEERYAVRVSPDSVRAGEVDHVEETADALLQVSAFATRDECPKPGVDLGVTILGRTLTADSFKPSLASESLDDLLDAWAGNPRCRCFRSESFKQAGMAADEPPRARLDEGSVFVRLSRDIL